MTQPLTTDRATVHGRETARDRFNRSIDRATTALGSIQAVVASVVVVVVWAITGPLFGFSDSWQLVINTSTTVITFWMVFVIQNSQNRDARALHLKLDEIIRATSAARNEFIVAERATEAEVEARERELQGMATGGPGPAPDARAGHTGLAPARSAPIAPWADRRPQP